MRENVDELKWPCEAFIPTRTESKKKLIAQNVLQKLNEWHCRIYELL